MKILIGIPAMDMVSVHFCRSLVTLAKMECCNVSFVVNSLIYSARNIIAMQAIQGDYDYVLWLDSDMVFEPDTLVRLLQDEKDIVTGIYFRRVKPYSPVLYENLEIRQTECIFSGVEKYPAEMFEVAGAGLGCMLMRTDVLKDIEATDGPVWFAPIGNVGEDLAFCIRARKLGYKVFCDPSVKLGHVGHAIITEANYDDRQ